WLSTAALFLLPVIVVYALSLYKPIFSARFFLPLIMFFLISIATAIDGLFGRRSIFAVAVLAGLMTMSAYSFASHEVLSWRKYIGLMHAECRGPEGVLFMTPNSQVGFNYYTRGITVAEGCAFSTYPYELKAENYLWKPDDYPALLDALASQHRVWIFESHSSEAESEILASYRRQIEAHFPHCRQMTDVHTLRLWACVR
ncbi:MAG: hypothetical protein LPK85_12880, partial [Gammaproteobacteria bacterium]|nr:hypothetical protein [Gammaproteobacteria bacterium]